jgi:lysine 2,3-aminomutase
LGKGVEIMEYLWGHTTGFAVPRFILDVPGGAGKTPVSPCYVLSRNDRMTIFRNYEGVISKYVEPEDNRSSGCPENCHICKERKQRGLDPCVGLASVFDGDVEVLEPAHLDRHARNA